MASANAALAHAFTSRGQSIAIATAQGQVDDIALASLGAGNTAASDGLARLVGERSFSVFLEASHSTSVVTVRSQ